MWWGVPLINFKCLSCGRIFRAWSEGGKEYDPYTGESIRCSFCGSSKIWFSSIEIDRDDSIHLFWARTRSIEAIVEAFYKWVQQNDIARYKYHVLCAVNDAGRREELVSPDDYPEYREVARYYLRHYGSLEDLKKLAWECVASKLGVDGVFGKPKKPEIKTIWDSISPDVWPYYFFKKVLRQAKERITTKIPLPRMDSESIAYCLAVFINETKKRHSTFKVVAEFLKAVWEAWRSTGGPFLRSDLEFKTRTLDLTSLLEPGEGEVILVVDIT